jgi:Protein of unknown function (DUF1588)/Protein of unknown function (DUF1592)/Protein of unknown function (DUF1595)/Protein of unknown function (DUF1585)
MARLWQAMRVLPALLLAGLAACSQGAAHSGSSTTPGQVLIRLARISDEQYVQIVHDVFGASIHVSEGLGEARAREEGLLAVGASKTGMTSSGYAAAERIAYEVATQVVDERNRSVLSPCRPTSEVAFDEHCARMFLAQTGRLLHRRSLTDSELARVMRIAASAANERRSFYFGIQAGVVALLISPNFLFRMEYAEPDPDARGQYRLTAVSMASRLSFLLWNTSPDSLLLDSAESGDLLTHKGRQRQIDRMMASRRLEDGVGAFFADMLQLDGFAYLSKDQMLFPSFTRQASLDAREQVLRVVLDQVVRRDGDYRDLFTQRRTFLTPALAAMLRIPLPQDAENGAPQRWQEYEFAEGDRRAGLLAEPGFVALHTHPGRTSPTLRGRAIREVLLCQSVPPPPPDVNFNIEQDQSDPAFKTMKQRLQAHATQPACAGCHKIMDPLGLPLESFDAVGAYRRTENDAPIDTTGTLDGVPFKDSRGLAEAIRNNTALASCMVQRVYSYGEGRGVTQADRAYLNEMTTLFRGNGYRFKSLLRELAGSEQFYREAALQ